MYAGQLISILFLVAQIYCFPYATQALNNTQSCAIFVNVLTQFVGIMIIIDYYLQDTAEKAGETYDSSSRSVVSVILFVGNLMVLGSPILIAAAQSGVLGKMFSWMHSGNLETDPALLEYYAANIMEMRPSLEESTKKPNSSSFAQISFCSTLVEREVQTELVSEAIADTHRLPPWPYELHLDWNEKITVYDDLIKWEPHQLPRIADLRPTSDLGPNYRTVTDDQVLQQKDVFNV